MNDAAKPESLSNRGRPRSVQPKDKWHVSIGSDVSLFFRMRLHDELTQTTRNGAMSELVDRLLRAEMKRLQGDAP